MDSLYGLIARLSGVPPGLAQTGVDWAGYDPFNPPEWRSGAGLPSAEAPGPRGALQPQVTVPMRAAPPLPGPGGGAYPFTPADWPGQAFQQGPPPPSVNPLFQVLGLLRGVSPLGLGAGLGQLYQQQLLRETYGPWTVQD